MNFPRKALLGSLLLMSASSAFAVDTADLTIIGTIAPAACTPTFAGGGVIDYGLVPSSSLSAAAETLLAERTISYAIHCDAPVSIATSWTDGRSGSAIVANNTTFGLGLQGANRIGRYTLGQVAADSTGDGAPVHLIFRDNVDGGWLGAGAISPQLNTGTRMQSYAPTGTVVPGAYSDFGGTIHVSPAIAATNTLDLTTAITIDGLSTMTVRYL